MKRQLISSDEATPAGKQPIRPCSDCPWARASLPGWLGGLSTQEWLELAHGEVRIECHVHPDAECAGAAVYRANVCKSPRDKRLLKLAPNRVDVFANRDEFTKHHKKGPKP